MVSNVHSHHNTQRAAGSCPHGMSPSACPICSGGGSGGGRMRDKATKPVKNEWSYARCLAAGRAMQAQKARVQEQKELFKKDIQFQEKFQKNIEKFIDKLQNFTQNIKNPILQAAANTVLNVAIKPFLNFVSLIPKVIGQFAEFGGKINEIFKQAGEKLTAILGDIQNFVERKFVENFKKRAKKFFLLFYSDIEDENYKNDETLEVFKSREIKKFLIKVFQSNRKEEKDTNAARIVEGKAE